MIRPFAGALDAREMTDAELQEALDGHLARGKTLLDELRRRRQLAELSEKRKR